MIWFLSFVFVWSALSASVGPSDVSAKKAHDRYPVWSPDGRQIAFQSNLRGNDDIFVMNDDGTGLRPVTDHLSGDYYPVGALMDLVSSFTPIATVGLNWGAKT